MKKNFNIIVALCLISFLFTYNATFGDAFKWVRISNLWVKVYDNGHQSQTEGNNLASYYFAPTYLNFFRGASTKLGTKNWIDEQKILWPVKIAGGGHDISDEAVNMFAREDKDHLTIHRYFRYKPPSIVVDGFVVNDPFPQDGDEVAPDKILGTADVMIESRIGLWMGVDVLQRVLVWCQKNHDDYAIWEFTLTNAGNIDRDDTIELPNQTLQDLYFLRELQCFPNSGMIEWGSWYGAKPGDSLRIMYDYPARTKDDAYDRFGNLRTANGYLRGPVYGGEAMLYVQKSPTDATDDLSQPRTHYIRGPDDVAFSEGDETHGPIDFQLIYDVMQKGYNVVRGTPLMEGVYPGTVHDLPLDERGKKLLTDFDWWYWHHVIGNASGPWTLKPGESIKIIWALAGGSISPVKAWEIAKAWKSGTLQPPPGCVFGVTDNLPPQYKIFPDLYKADSYSSAINNWAKDCWVATGRDSLLRNAMNAQWAVKNKYSVPTGPPPPSIEVASRPDRVQISWGKESESATDFAGYNVYRAIPTSDSIIYNRIFSCGAGTPNPLTHSYDDITAQRGIGYAYYVTAFDNGTGNIPDYNGKKEILESSIYLNRTDMRKTYLTRVAKTLSTVRVVPNPFNLSAVGMQFTGEQDKIMFLNLPPVCTIKIYSESGDLVKTLNHTSGSGDEPWGNLSQEFSVTKTGQVIVSGIYIALIEIPTGERNVVKFVVVR